MAWGISLVDVSDARDVEATSVGHTRASLLARPSKTFRYDCGHEPSITRQFELASRMNSTQRHLLWCVGLSGSGSGSGCASAML